MQQPEGMPKAVVFIANSLPPIGTCWPNAGPKHVYLSVSEAMETPGHVSQERPSLGFLRLGVLIGLPKLSSN